MACKYKYKDKWYSEIEVKNQLLKDISLNDVIVELSSQMSYAVEINTAKDKIKDAFSNVWVDEYPNKKIGDYITIDNKQWKITGTRFEDDSWGDSGLEQRESFIVGSEGENTSYYSNLTVPGGTNGSYREVNIESPLITLPKSHAQFNTEHTLMFSRMDDVQTYSEKDIEKLISLMENNGQLKIKCNS